MATVLASAAAGLFVAAEPIAAFDVAVIAVCAALIAWRPYAALVALLLLRATLATSPSGVIVDFLTLCAGGVALLACARSLSGWRVVLPFAAFLLIALPTVPLLPSPDEGSKALWLELPIIHAQYLRAPSNEMYEFIRLAVALVAFAWAAWAVDRARQVSLIVTVILVSAAYPVLDGLTELATGRTHARAGGFDSVLGPFSHPNGFASYLLIVLVLAIVAFAETRSLARRVALTLLISGGLVCLMFTYTRAAWVGFAIALALLGLLRYRRLLVVGLVAALVAAVAAPGATQRAQERFDDLSSDSQTFSRNSWRWRTETWGEMVPYGLERPAFGRGFASYARGTLDVFGLQHPQFPASPREPGGSLGFGAHNDYVKMLVEMGVVGLLLWVLTLSGVVVVALRARRHKVLLPWATAALTITVTFCLVAVADNVQTKVIDMIYLFALAGALAGATSQLDRSRRRTLPEPVEHAAAPVRLPAAEHEQHRAPAPPEPAEPPAEVPSRGGLRRRAGSWLRRKLL